MLVLFHLTTLIFLVINEGNSEEYCNPKTRYRCFWNNFCISRAKTCNGYQDCMYGEDERNCGPGFHDNERDLQTAFINGYTCRGICREGVRPCKGPKKSCVLDDECGFSCINKNATCEHPPPVVEHSIRYEIWKATPDKLQKIRPGLPTLYGYVASYVCETGRRFEGPLPRCSGTKQWSNEVPVCVDIACRSPVPILPNAISYSFRSPGRRWSNGIHYSNKTLPLVGYVVQYSCGENLHLVGHPPICNSDLEWTQSTMKCVVPYSSSDSALRRNFEADQSGRGQEIYFMFDVSGSVLKDTESLKAEIEFAKRLVQRLNGFRGYINYGIIVFASSNVTVLDIAASPPSTSRTEIVIQALTDVYTNAVGHTYEYQARSGTDTAYALRRLKDKMSFMKQQPEAKDNFRHVFIFTDGQHTNGEDPVKVRKEIENEFYKNITFYSITACTQCAGDELDELIGLSSGVGENFIVIEDFYQLSKYLDQVTDLKMDFEKCGQAGKVGNIDDQARLSLQRAKRAINGRDSNANAWPWQAVITKYHNSPDKVLGENSLVGGGSIINKQWILTAAHVLHISAWHINWKKSYVVSVGVFEIPTDGAELKSTIEMYSIDKYIEHEDFDSVTVAKDIALIKLGARYDSKMQINNSNTEGLVFSYYIRPVCLPCKGTCLTEEISLHGNVNLEGKGSAERCLAEEKILLRNDAKVVATGFGHLDAFTIHLRRPHFNFPKILQQVLLKIGDSQTCRKGIDDINVELQKLGGLTALSYSEENNICCVSGNPNRITDTCQGDNGGPVVREVMNTETGEACWIQIGIVSFGLGCGQKNLPSYDTNVARFISWIDSKILDPLP